MRLVCVPAGLFAKPAWSASAGTSSRIVPSQPAKTAPERLRANSGLSGWSRVTRSWMTALTSDQLVPNTRVPVTGVLPAAAGNSCCSRIRDPSAIPCPSAVAVIPRRQSATAIWQSLSLQPCVAPGTVAPLRSRGSRPAGRMVHRTPVRRLTPERCRAPVTRERVEGGIQAMPASAALSARGFAVTAGDESGGRMAAIDKEAEHRGAPAGALQIQVRGTPRGIRTPDP